LSSYYAGRSLAPEQCERLEALAQADRAANAAMYKSRAGWSTASLLGVAATVAILASGLTMMAMRQRDNNVMHDAPNFARNTPHDPSTIRSDTAAPRLVAVKFQVDGCPLSAAVEPKFAEAQRRFGERDVLFCRLNITTTAEQKQARYLAESLGIDCVYGGPCRSGTLMLVDREKDELVAVATNVNEVAKWESALAQAAP